MTIQHTISRQISPAQMLSYTELIYKTAGVRIPQEKSTLLSNRIRKRLKATGIESFGEYLEKLKSISPTDKEWDAFLQEITTHETYLFRDDHHWDWLRNEYLPELSKEAKEGKRTKTLRFWSAAASTGDEAFSIATCVMDRLMRGNDWAVEIFGSDIACDSIATARRGEFGERAMRQVPEEYKRRYFKHIKEEQRWEAKEPLKKLVKFRVHNLMKPLMQRPFDVIFVKNVLIYFDTKSKESAIRNIINVMKRGGLLVAGPAEGVSDLLADKLERVKPWLYRKN